MGILHDERAGRGARLLHCGLQLTLSYVLNLLIDGEDYVLSWFWLFLYAAKPFPAGVDGDHHAARLATEFVVVLAFNTAQALVIHAHVAEDLRGQVSVWVVALGFLFKVNSAQVEFADAAGGLGIGFAGHPAESAPGFALRQDFARIRFRNAGDQRDGAGQVRNIRRDGKGGIDRNRHRKFPASAVKDDAAARGNCFSALLLTLGASLKISVAEDLEINESQADSCTPEDENGPE